MQHDIHCDLSDINDGHRTIIKLSKIVDLYLQIKIQCNIKKIIPKPESIMKISACYRTCTAIYIARRNSGWLAGVNKYFGIPH